MLTRIPNSMGVITYSRQIIDQIIDNAFESVRGRLWLANYRGAVSDMLVKLSGFDSIAEKRVEMREGGLYIKLFVVIRLGESMTGSCDKVMKDIADDVTGLLELPLDNIEVAVTGTVSKNNNIARRDVLLNYRDALNSRRKVYG